MEPIEFEEQTIVIAKDQPEYRSLPAYLARDANGTTVFCWKLTWKERLQLLFTGKIWHTILTFNTSLQPQLLETTKPEMK